MKQLKRALLIFLIGTSTLCLASPVNSFFATHQQTMLFTAGSFVMPFMAANIALLAMKQASFWSTANALLITGFPCVATLLARSALDRWTTLPDDQLLYYGGWCAVGLCAILGAAIAPQDEKSQPTVDVQSGDANSAKGPNVRHRLICFAAFAFIGWLLVKCGTGTLRFANWIAEIKR